MRRSHEVCPRPTLLGFMVPNQASNKQKCSLKWAEGKGCVLVMQDTLFSSKLCSPFQSSAKNRATEPLAQGWCLEGPCDPQWLWMYFEENHETVRNWFQGSEFGQDKTVRENVSQETWNEQTLPTLFIKISFIFSKKWHFTVIAKQLNPYCKYQGFESQWQKRSGFPCCWLVCRDPLGRGGLGGEVKLPLRARPEPHPGTLSRGFVHLGLESPWGLKFLCLPVLPANKIPPTICFQDWDCQRLTKPGYRLLLYLTFLPTFWCSSCHLHPPLAVCLEENFLTYMVVSSNSSTFFFFLRKRKGIFL